MKKIGVLFLIIGIAMATQIDPLKKIKSYENNGVHSLIEWANYKKLFNKYVSPRMENKRIDTKTKIDRMQFVGDTLVLEKSIFNKKSFEDELKKMLKTNKITKKELNKLVYYTSLGVAYWDAATLCKGYDNAGFYTYGGKFKEIVNDKIFNRKFTVTVNNPQECKKTRKKFENIIIKLKNFLNSVSQKTK